MGRSDGLWQEPVFLAGRRDILSPFLPLPTFSSLLLGDEMRGLSLSPAVGSPPGPPGDLEDEEGLKHLQQVVGRVCLCMLKRPPLGSL